MNLQTFSASFLVKRRIQGQAVLGKDGQYFVLGFGSCFDWLDTRVVQSHGRCSLKGECCFMLGASVLDPSS
jgi:hypothetical protein